MYMFTEAQLKNQDYKFICKKCGQENKVALPADADVREHDKEQGLPNEQEQAVPQGGQGTDTENTIDSAIDNAIDSVIDSSVDKAEDSPADKEQSHETAAPAGTAPEPDNTVPDSAKSGEGKADLEDIFASLEMPQDKDKQPADVHAGETIPESDFIDGGKADTAAAKPTEKAPANEELNKDGDVIEGFEEFTMDDIKGEGTTAPEQSRGSKESGEADTSWLESTSLEESPAGKTGDNAEGGVLPEETVPMEEENISELADTKQVQSKNVPSASEEESSLLDEHTVAVPESIPETQDTTARQKAVAEKKHLSKLLLASAAGIVIVLAALMGVYYYLVEYTPAHPDFKKLTFMSYSVIPASAKAKVRAEQLLNEADKQYLKGTISGYESSLNLYEEAVAADHHLVQAYTGIAKDYAVLKERNNLQDQLKNSGKFLARLKEMLKDNAQYNLTEAMINIANNDYQQASREIDTALQKSPSLPEALYYRGYIDFKQGQSMTQAASLLTQATSLEPDMVKAKLLLARIYRQQEPSRAVDILNTVLAGYPYNISAVTLKADIQASSVTGATQAIADLNAVLNKAGNTMDAYDKANLFYTIGQLQMKTGNYPPAIEAFKNSLQNNKSVKTYIALGDAYLKSGNMNEAEDQYKAAIAADSTTLEGNLKLAQAYYLDKKYVLAVSYYNECLKLEKNNPDVLYGMALAREGNGELDTALRTIETAVHQSPDNPAFMTLNGRLLRKKKDYKNAAAILSGAVAKFPSYAPLHTEYAVVLGKEGDYDNAIRQLNTAMSISPVSADNNAYMADMLERESKHTQAEKYALKALSIDNTLPYAYEVLGDIYFGEHKLSDSIKAYNSSIAMKPYEARVFYKLANVYIAGKVFTSAVSSLESAIKINPVDAVYHYALGNVYRDIGNIQFAINEYTKAVNIDGTMADAYFQRGLINIAGKNDLAAINDLKNAMKYAPGNPVYMLALSKYYYNNKETYSAIDYLERALKIAPKNPEIHYRLGVAYNYIGKIEDAKKEFLTALDISPRYSEAMVGLGNISYQNGDMNKAQQYYEKAIQITPDEGDAYYALGTVYESNGMYEKALTEYKYAAKFSKNPAAAFYKEGIMFSNLNEPEQAKAALLKAVSLGLSSDMETIAKNKLRNLM
jgi:tetratricopeptide (TPR) repeat protein